MIPTTLRIILNKRCIFILFYFFKTKMAHRVGFFEGQCSSNSVPIGINGKASSHFSESSEAFENPFPRVCLNETLYCIVD